MLYRSGKPWALPLLLLLSGCSREFGDNRLTWVWAVAPLAIYGILGTYGVFWHRKDQLAQWDLRTAPVPPDGRAAVTALSTVATVVAFVFGFLNYLANDVDTTQKLLNLAAWCAGSAISAGLAVMVGRMLAERGYTRKEN